MISGRIKQKRCVLIYDFTLQDKWRHDISTIICSVQYVSIIQITKIKSYDNKN